MRAPCAGRISRAAVGLGGVEMIPGKVARFPTRYGGKGIFIPGLWTVQYNPVDRELAVKIVVEHFYMDMGKQALEGDSTDIFVGSVSQDSRVWEADWFAFGRFIGHIPEPNEFYNVSEDDMEYRDSLVFRKVKQEK